MTMSWEHRQLDELPRLDALRVEGAPIEPPLSLAVLAEGNNVLVIHVNAPAGARTPTHVHGHESVVYVLDGTVRCSLPESTERLTPGSTLVISEGCPHSLGTDEGAAWLEIKSPPQATWH